MPTDEQANVVDHVLFVEHDFPCPVRHCSNIAWLDMSTNLYKPCTACQARYKELRIPLAKVFKTPWYKKIFGG